jgi:hypothetical protein
VAPHASSALLLFFLLVVFLVHFLVRLLAKVCGTARPTPSAKAMLTTRAISFLMYVSPPFERIDIEKSLSSRRLKIGGASLECQGISPGSGPARPC